MEFSDRNSREGNYKNTGVSELASYRLYYSKGIPVTGAGVSVVALRVMAALILSSAVVRAAGISVKADKLMAEFDGRAWDDYQWHVLAHLNACGLLGIHAQAARGTLTVTSNGTPEEKALRVYPSLPPVG